MNNNTYLNKFGDFYFFLSTHSYIPLNYQRDLFNKTMEYCSKRKANNKLEFKNNIFEPITDLLHTKNFWKKTYNADIKDEDGYIEALGIKFYAKENTNYLASQKENIKLEDNSYINNVKDEVNNLLFTEETKNFILNNNLGLNYKDLKSFFYGIYIMNLNTNFYTNNIARLTEIEENYNLYTAINKVENKLKNANHEVGDFTDLINLIYNGTTKLSQLAKEQRDLYLNKENVKDENRNEPRRDTRRSNDRLFNNRRVKGRNKERAREFYHNEEQRAINREIKEQSTPRQDREDITSNDYNGEPSPQSTTDGNEKEQLQYNKYDLHNNEAGSNARESNENENTKSDENKNNIWENRQGTISNDEEQRYRERTDEKEPNGTDESNERNENRKSNGISKEDNGNRDDTKGEGYVREPRSLIALNVGYEFILSEKDNKELENINLRKQNYYVNVDNKAYEVYIGDTFEDSRKIDKLMDSNEYKTYKLSEHIGKEEKQEDLKQEDITETYNTHDISNTHDTSDTYNTQETSEIQKTSNTYDTQDIDNTYNIKEDTIANNTQDNQDIGSSFFNGEKSKESTEIEELERIENENKFETPYEEVDISQGKNLDFINALGLQNIDDSLLDRNYHIEDNDIFKLSSNSYSNDGERFNDNIEAIKLLNKIDSYTNDDLNSLNNYTGFGGLARTLENKWDRTKLKKIVSPTEYAKIEESTLTAFYTPTFLTKAITEKIEESGFKGGRILEPSMGTGRFFGSLSKNVVSNSNLYGVELDNITGKIAQALYPSADIKICGFEKTSFNNNTFDLAIGNVPFGDFSVYDKNYPKMYIHDYFFIKTIDKVRNGGIIAFITSSGTMDKKNSKIREEIAERCEFLGAVRLPLETFTDTTVSSDIIFLRKRDNPISINEIPGEEKKWVKTKEVEIDGKPYHINSYFADNQDKIVGKLSTFNTGFGNRPCSQINNEVDFTYYEKYNEELKEILEKATNPDLKSFYEDNELKEKNIVEYIMENSPYSSYEPWKKSYFKRSCMNLLEQIRLKNEVKSAISSIDFQYIGVYREEKAEQRELETEENKYEMYSNFCFNNINGEIYLREDNEIIPLKDVIPKSNKRTKEKIKSYIEIKEVLKDILSSQVDPNISEEELGAKREKLNTLYDTFYENYGFINSSENKKIFKHSDDFYLLSAIEKTEIDPTKDKDNIIYKGKEDIFYKRTSNQREVIEKTEDLKEALILSISEKGKVDFNYIENLTNKTKDEIIKELRGEIFLNIKKVDFDKINSSIRDYYNSSHRDKNLIETNKLQDIIVEEFSKIYNTNNEYVTEDEYLTGDILSKIDIIDSYINIIDRIEKLSFNELNTKENSMLQNIKNELEFNKSELLRVKPQKIKFSEINYRLGSTFIPTNIYDEFLYSLERGLKYDIGQVEHNKLNADGAQTQIGSGYRIPKSRSNSVNSYVSCNTTYGTSRINAVQLVEMALNNQSPKVYDTIEENGKEKKVLNKKETTLATEKQEEIKIKFKKFIEQNERYQQEIEEIYNKMCNRVRNREYNGDNLKFLGMNSQITLRKHQKDAIARTLYGGNTLLAHVVGAGKTFEMIASGMESKRLGLCNKPLYVVPKPIVDQFAKEFMTLYPGANILVANDNKFSGDNKKRFIGQMATGSYDGIIISHNNFEKIGMSKEYILETLDNDLQAIYEAIGSLDSDNKEERLSIKKLQKIKKKLEEQRERIIEDATSDDVINFDELGIDKLYLDEAHMYKNLYFYSRLSGLSGIASNYTKKTNDLFMKVRYLDKITNNKGTVFATGTPVSNSMAELYTMQRYLQYDYLCETDKILFDDWVGQFGEVTTSYQIAPEGNKFQIKPRINKYSNLPELINDFKMIADIKTADMLDLDLPNATYETIVTKPSKEQVKLLEGLSKRADRCRDGKVDPSEDNMLLITHHGKMLALDQRILDPSLPDDENSKVNTLVKNVYDIYQKTNENKSTQLIFCDSSVPGGQSDVTIYDDIKAKLIKMGMKEDEIAFIHDAGTSDVKRQELFTKMNNGDIRVMLGSTSKLGTGVNVQKKLIATHDLDIPWRPSDLEQRAGRIVRQGNENKEVKIFRYLTEKTFDSYLFQTLENKQRFISQIMTSKAPSRAMEEIDECVLSYAEAKALVCGNEKIKTKMELENKIQKIEMLKSSYLQKKEYLKNLVQLKLPNKIKELKDKISNIKKDVEIYNKNANETVKIEGNGYVEQSEINKAINRVITRESINFKNSSEVNLLKKIGEYKGNDIELSLDKGLSKNYIVINGNYKTYIPFENAVLWHNIKNKIDKLPEILKRNEDELGKEENNYTNAKKELETPFEKEDELNNAIRELAQINLELELESNEKVDEEIENNEEEYDYEEDYGYNKSVGNKTEEYEL